MKDFFGYELAIGDKVAFNPPTYKGLTNGVVVKFTPKGCRVMYKSYHGEEVTTAFQVVKKIELPVKI